MSPSLAFADLAAYTSIYDYTKFSIEVHEGYDYIAGSICKTTPSNRLSQIDKCGAVTKVISVYEFKNNMSKAVHSYALKTKPSVILAPLTRQDMFNDKTIQQLSDALVDLIRFDRSQGTSTMDMRMMSGTFAGFAVGKIQQELKLRANAK
jgi:hypothetical protein